MAKVLLIRFDAPLMSFGGVLVDQLGVTRDAPAKSMITGLLANALGYEHRDFQLIQRLQERVLHAVRQDRAGEELVDFQTVDLGQDFMLAGWTTRGEPEGRKGGAAKAGTHIRYRHYLADAIYTVALQLLPEDEEPTLEMLDAALSNPARPLFIGRKPCLPSVPMALGIVNAPSLIAALETCERDAVRTGQNETFLAWLNVDDGADDQGNVMPITDERDWANQIHTGRRFMRSGRFKYREGHDGND